MQEIEVKENPLKLKVFINGIPERKSGEYPRRFGIGNLCKYKKRYSLKITYSPNFV